MGRENLITSGRTNDHALLQAMESWAGPGNEAAILHTPRPNMPCMLQIMHGSLEFMINNHPAPRVEPRTRVVIVTHKPQTTSNLIGPCYQ